MPAKLVLTVVLLGVSCRIHRGGYRSFAVSSLPHQQMWTPIDINALPTAKDTIDAKIAIEEVEKQLRKALYFLDQARFQVASIKSDLQRRRAWLSPVRRLNFDVLCRIFELAAEADGTAAIRLASVSRIWRFTALSIPRAWAFLDIKRTKGPKMINLYLERSGQHLFHIGLPSGVSYTKLAPMRERLQCLSIYSFPLYVEGIVFPQVTKLYIRNADGGVFPASITRKYFPALRHLYCQSNFTRKPGHRFEDDARRTYDLPPLETVDLQVTADTTWACFLLNCSKTVTSLRLVPRGVIFLFQQRYSMTMPLLKCLEISGRLDLVHAWPLILKTPVLESYITDSWHLASDRPIHSDLETVKLMRLGRVQPLMNCTSLRYLQIFKVESGLYPILEMLEGDMALCPRLEVIVVVVAASFPLDDTEFTRRVEEVSKGRTGLKVLRQKVIMERFEGEINSSCGKDMPCSYSP